MNHRMPRVTLGVLCLAYLGTNCGSSGGDSNNAPGGSNSTGGQSAGSTGTPLAGRGGDADSGAGGQLEPDSAGAAGELGGEGGTGGALTTSTGCDTRDISGATRVSAAITKDQTWSNTVYIEQPVAVRAGAHLTISPGTDVIVAAGAGLVLGADQTAVTLTAAGTVARPIRFCGAEEKLGAWTGIVAEAGANVMSELRNVSIADAGASDAAVVLKSAMLVENLRIVDSASDGIWASDFDAESQELGVEGAVGSAVVLTDSAAATHFPRGGTIQGNGDNAVHLRFSEMNAVTTFHDVGLPYVQETDVAAPEGKLTFEAGVEYRFAAGVGLLLGAELNKYLLLSATGTAASPIVFRGLKSEPGSWGSIQVINNVDPSSVLSNVEIHDGGSNLEVLYVRSALRLDHLLLDGNGGGLYVATQGLAPSSSALTVRNTAGPPMNLAPNALITIPRGGTFTGNQSDNASVLGGDFTVSGVVPNPGIPFFVTGAIRTLTGSSMTLSAGTQFTMTGSGSFQFAADGGSATVIAVGTQDAPIRFAGALPRVGYWSGLTTGGELSSSSKFDFIDVRHAKAACLTLIAPVAVTHSSFSDCSGYGILKNIDDTSDYSITNSFTNVVSGKIGNLPP